MNWQERQVLDFLVKTVITGGLIVFVVSIFMASLNIDYGPTSAGKWVMTALLSIFVVGLVLLIEIVWKG